MIIKTYEQAKNVFENSKKRKITNNTYLAKIVCDEAGKQKNVYVIKLHDTDIIQFWPNKTVLNSGNYRTSTTKERLNTFTPFTINQVKGIWYITDYISTVIFQNGIYFKNGKFHNFAKSNKSSLELRKKIKQYVKDYIAEFFAGKMLYPGPGDCFYCQFDFTNQKTGKIENPNTEHIISHIKEKYYVPSLLVKAIKDFPVSIAAQSVIAHFWSSGQDCEFFYDIAKRQLESSLKRYCYRMTGTAS